MGKNARLIGDFSVSNNASEKLPDLTPPEIKEWVRKIMKVQLIDDKVGGFKVVINNTHFGSFDQLNGPFEPYRFFPKLTDRMTGNHFIVIGEALNKLNQQFE